MVKLSCLEIQNFKSFGQNPIKIDGLDKMNIFIGKSNSGKSNITEALDLIFNGINIHGTKINFEGRRINLVDRNYWFGQKLKNGGNPISIIVKINFFFDEFDWPLLFKDARPIEFINTFIKDNQNNQLTLTFKIFTKDEKTTNFSISSFKIGENDIIIEDAGTVKFKDIRSNSLSQNDQYNLIKNLNQIFSNHFTKIYAVKKADENVANSFQQYEIDLTKDKLEVYNKINECIQELFQDFTQTKTYKHLKGNEIYLQNNKINLPLSYNGSGIEQIFMILFHIYSDNNKIIAIEEPESHLDVWGQKRLFDFLKKIAIEENKQFFITTHSNTFIDHPESKNIYLVKKSEKNETEVSKINNEEERYEILDELGIKASDILQSDGIIFVEGPTDKNVFKEFFKKEGIDLGNYNISLIHLGGLGNITTQDIQDLVKINRNFVLILDSDKKSPKDNIPTLNINIKNKFRQYGKKCYILKKRGIENYFSKKIICEVLKISESDLKFGDFDDLKETINILEKKLERPLRYSKIQRGKEIAKKMNSEDIDNEIKDLLKDCLSSLDPSVKKEDEFKGIMTDYKRSFQDWKERNYLASEDRLDKFFQFRKQFKFNEEDYKFILHSSLRMNWYDNEWVNFFGKEKTETICLEILKNQGSRMYEAIWVLGEIKSKKAILPLIEIIEKNEDESICDTAINQFIYNFEDERVVKHLLDILKNSSNHKLRKGSASALGKYKQKKVIDALKEVLEDSRAEVRSEAASSLGKIKDEGTIEFLIEALEGEYSFRVKKNLIYALSKFVDKRIINLFNQLLKSEEDSRIKEDLKYYLKILKKKLEELPTKLN